MALIIDGIKFNPNDDKIMSNFTDFDSHDMMSETNISHPTEMGETIDKLNDDSPVKRTRMTGIDLRSHLHYMEIQGILAVDGLVNFRFLSRDCQTFTQSKKRLNVSLDGRGRNDIVNIAGGKREQDARTAGGMSLIDKMKGLFAPNTSGDIK